MEKNILCFAFLYCINYSDLTGQYFKGETVSGQMKGIAMHFPAVPVLLTSAIYRIILSFGSLRACLHGGGGPQVGEVAPLGGVTRLSIQSLIRSPQLSCKHDQIKMRDYLDKWVTSPTWGPLPPCRQALNETVDAAFI